MQLPKEFTDQMIELLGSDYEEYEKSFLAPRVYGLRVNTEKISVEDFLKITPFHLTQIPWVENGFYYLPDEPVSKHPHYFAGLYYIQEPSAMIPASRLPVRPGERVLDLCAAPGGKATELGVKLAGDGLLVANDISSSRAKGLLKNLEIFGIGNILVTSEEPAKLKEYFPEFFDKILIDVPCSGEGMFRKDPAMIRSWKKNGPSHYAPIQRNIADIAVQMLKPGGMLLYSTCTFSTLENEGTIQYLLEKHPALKLIPLKHYAGFVKSSLTHCIRVYPHKVSGEGHFAALFSKEEDREMDSLKVKDQPVKHKAAKIPEDLYDFLDDFTCFENTQIYSEIRNDKVYLLQKDFPGIKGLRFLRAGLYMGELKKKRFEPSQALAMYLKKEDYKNCISFSSKDGQVIRYLKGETLELPEAYKDKKGWVLVCVDEYPLGWGKMLNGALRNKYHAGWRMLS